jgi:hypothetical protein
MSTPEPRELLLVLVEADSDTITATFDLGAPLPHDAPTEWFTYGLTLMGSEGGPVKQFGVRFSPTETKAFIFDFASTTQANYEASHVDDRGSSVVVRFVDAALGVDSIGSLSGFGTVEGKDVAVDVPVQLLT